MRGIMYGIVCVVLLTLASCYCQYDPCGEMQGNIRASYPDHSQCREVEQAGQRIVVCTVSERNKTGTIYIEGKGQRTEYTTQLRTYTCVEGKATNIDEYSTTPNVRVTNGQTDETVPSTGAGSADPEQKSGSKEININVEVNQ